MKEVERAHTPKYLWEKIKLSNNYTDAIKQLDEQLQYWPQWQVNRIKERFTRITQYLIRMRKLKLRVENKLVRINKKVEKRERRREAGALRAARLKNSISKELLERLKQGNYNDIYEIDKDAYLEEKDDEKQENDEEEEEEEEEEKEISFEEFVEEYSDDLEDCKKKKIPIFFLF